MMYVWVCIVVKCVYDACVCVRARVCVRVMGGGGLVFGGVVCVCVWYCFLSTLKIFAFL